MRIARPSSFAFLSIVITILSVLPSLSSCPADASPGSDVARPQHSDSSAVQVDHVGLEGGDPMRIPMGPPRTYSDFLSFAALAALRASASFFLGQSRIKWSVAPQ